MPDDEKPDALSKMGGAESAAILLMALGESDAQGIMQHIEPEEVKAIGEAINKMPNITQLDIAGVLEKFVGDVKNESSLAVGGGQYFKNLLISSLGREKAGSVLSSLDKEAKPPGLDSLKWMPARTVAKIVSTEHPQVIAAVLSCLPRSHAGEVLEFLPEEIRADVIVRVIELDTIHPDALKELDEIVTLKFQENPGNFLTEVGGLQTGAEILNVVSTAIEENVLEQIEKLKPGLSGKVKEKMFLFEGLLKADDRGLQTLLREVAKDQLTLAIKGASEEMKEKIFRNMSANAAELLKDDLEASGPVRLADVEDAQKEVLTLATKLAEDGRLILAGNGAEFV